MSVISNRAIEYYSKGWKITEDYYTGENYAFCLNLKSTKISSEDEKTYCKYEAKQTREKIIQILEETISEDDFENRNDKKWIFASLAHCYLAANNRSKSNEFEEIFLHNSSDWEKETFIKSKNQLLELL